MSDGTEDQNIMARLREWEPPEMFKLTGLTGIEAIFDAGMRHGRHEPKEYLKAWLKIARMFAYATHDDSWGELEKELAIIFRNYVHLMFDAQEAANEIERLRAEQPA